MKVSKYFKGEHMFKFLKSLFEDKTEHRCQVCGEIYIGKDSFTSSEICTYSHETDTTEQESRYPKTLRKEFQKRKDGGETRDQFISLLLKSWEENSKKEVFLDNISKTYLPVGIYNSLNNNDMESLSKTDLDNESHVIYEKLNKSLIL